MSALKHEHRDQTVARNNKGELTAGQKMKGDDIKGAPCQLSNTSTDQTVGRNSKGDLIAGQEISHLVVQGELFHMTTS